MDNLGVIVEIVYIGQERVEPRNLSQLIGWHEAYLNSASFTYTSGLISDWISFFRENWATALYHDKFPELASELRKLMESDQNLFAILDAVFETAENSSDDQIVAGRRREIIGDRCELLGEASKHALESHTLDFLRKHKQLLSRFHIPQLIGKSNVAADANKPVVPPRK